MAIGKASDFKIYPEQIHAGLVETLMQNTAAFNQASRNAIRMVSNRIRGDYKYDTFFKDIASLVTRRDTTSVSAATDLALAQAELISVKLNRKIGPVANTLDSFRKIGSQANVDSLSFLIGTQVAKGMQADQLNSGLTAVRAALNSVAALKHTVASSGTLATADLVDGLSKFGDAANNVVIWVMHSKQYYDLVKSQIAANIDGVSNFNVASGSPVTLNRPVLVTDSDSLKVTTGTGTAAVTDYFCLGLTESGVILEDSEEELVHAELVTGLENLVVRLQGEFAYNLGLRGIQWDVANGGANPAAAALGTGSNWDKVATDNRSLPGVIVQSR